MTENDLVFAASFRPNSLQFPNAWVGHLPFAAWVIQEVSPKIFVELGTHSGNSYFSFCQSVLTAGLGTKCYAVDTWQGDDHAGQYDNGIFNAVDAHNQAHYSGFSRLLRMKFDDAVGHFQDQSIDLLHIDGLHTYEAVCHDFKTWLPKLAPGALVLFHDTNVRERDFGVWKLWNELEIKYPNNLEFLHSHGLGVLQLNNAVDSRKLEWLRPDSAVKPKLVKYFSALGARQVEHFELNELRQNAASLEPLMRDFNNQIANYKQAAVERDQRIISLNHALAEKDAQISNHCQAAGERDALILNLDKSVNEREINIHRLNQALTDRDNKIAGINQGLAERDRQLASINQDLAECNGQIANVTHDLEERDRQIASINQNLEERDRQIASINRDLEDRGSQIASFTQKLEEWEKQITKFNQDLAERDRQIANLNEAAIELNQQLASHNQAATDHHGQLLIQHKAVAERDGQISNHSQIIADRDVQVSDLNLAMLDRDGRIVSLHEALALHEHELATLRGSASWRITNPLRVVYGAIRRKRDQFRFVRVRGVQRALSLIKRSYKEVAQELDNLPPDFNGVMYLKLNPDVADAGADATTHYLFHGRREGRVYSVPDICLDYDINVSRETVFLVSHEASRTGAPVLSLNVVQGLVDRYNVIVLLLGGGPLSDAFRFAGAGVITSSNLRGNPVLAHLIVGQLCVRFNFKFAIVNSIESRVVLPALGDYFVPAISLVHEFASYTRPRGAFREALFWSGEVVFSANVTKENALAEYPDLGDRSVHILPQGRCLLPSGEFNEDQMLVERARIRHLVRPDDIAENSVIILGAGYVQLRKGVDLFIECASRVVRAPEGNRCRFVWIGKGYDPDNDIGYSVYLADQIRRAGLAGHVFFVDETNAIEAAYEAADLFLLSSRLDPLPNVAIDAMAHGVPVLCFNKTTGIADFLMESGLRDYCVAEYLDSADLAEKILALAGSPHLRNSVADQCLKASSAYFSMPDYIARIEDLARDVCARTLQEKADTQIIFESGLFRHDFSMPRRQGQPLESAVREYVRAWASGIGRRKPFPGFHPGIYLEQHGVAIPGADPFADYLRKGQPKGPWNYTVIVAGETQAKNVPSSERVALHLHVYYPELLSEIMNRLANNRICPDLFISITDEEIRASLVCELKNYKGRLIDIQVVPNRGRDIGPFLTGFGEKIKSNYDFIGHIHTKKSADVKDASMGQVWYRFLLENLLGGESGAMADRILAEMNDDPAIGMVFPDDPHVVGWSDNRAFADKLALRIGVQNLPEHFIFPIGTMFWARTEALAPVMNLGLEWDDYPDEPLPYDGSTLHAIERLLSVSLLAGNLRSATTNVIGLTR